jgi:hypothetical protein
VFAVLFVGMGVLGFLGYRYFAHRGEPLNPAPVPPVRTPRAATPDSATPTANVLNKYIEVTGLRLLEENPRNLQVAFVVVNHSQAPLTDVAGTVAIRPTNAPPNGETVGTFIFKLPELGPLAVKDLKAPLQSKLRVYELPDWQFIRADVTITSPRPNPCPPRATNNESPASWPRSTSSIRRPRAPYITATPGSCWPPPSCRRNAPTSA